MKVVINGKEHVPVKVAAMLWDASVAGVYKKIKGLGIKPVKVGGVAFIPLEEVLNLNFRDRTLNEELLNFLLGGEK